MKVITPKEMIRIESLAYAAGAKSEDFMEEVGRKIALRVEAFIQEHRLPQIVTLLCGKGNNAGDVYVAGFYLLNKGYAHTAYQLIPFDLCSPLCKKNYQRFIEAGGLVIGVSSAAEFLFPPHGLIIDGLFGTGFTGEVTGLFAAAIAAANGSNHPIISIDIPSGINGLTGEVAGVAIQAQETLCLGLPKIGFFLREGWNHAGRLNTLEFGLENKFIQEAEEVMVMLTSPLVKPLLPPFCRNRNKYEAGVVAGWAGSPGMSGAALLAAKAVLRGGAGIVRLLHPQGMQQELSASPLEIIREPFEIREKKKLIESLNRADACFLGPGLGRKPETETLLEDVVNHLQKPCVIDADALTMLADKDISFPTETILTPHLGEMRRLLQDPTHEPISQEILSRCQEYADKKKITLVLKGGPTFILTPGEAILVCPRGDPGMATAGSGDVLTGLIAALLAQGMKSRESATLGVYLHALAGEWAAGELSSYCLMASDILEAFPKAFKNLLANLEPTK